MFQITSVSTKKKVIYRQDDAGTRVGLLEKPETVSLPKKQFGIGIGNVFYRSPGCYGCQIQL